MNGEKTAREIHGEALRAQENGDFSKALELTDDAVIAYQKAGDHVGFAEIQSMRFLIFRHLAESTGDGGYMVLAKFAAFGGVELAEKSGDPNALAIPLFNLAKAHDTLGEYPQAVEAYRRAIGAHKGREAVESDMTVHMEVCAFRGGDETALARAESALKKLAGNQEADTYSKNVWLSGGHMKIAQAVSGFNRSLAVEHMKKAREIIDSDERLKLRQEQWEKLYKEVLE